MDAGQASTSEDLSVWDLVLPLYAEKFSGARVVEVVQLSDMALIDCPCFTTIEQCGENYGPVHLDLCLEGDASPVPTFLWSLPKAALALASLAFTSSSMTTFLESVLPR